MVPQSSASTREKKKKEEEIRLQQTKY